MRNRRWTYMAVWTAVLALSITMTTACSDGKAQGGASGTKAGGSSQVDPVTSDSPSGSQDEEEEPADPALAALVNKTHPLQDSYAPDDLVMVEVPTIFQNAEVNQLRKEAAEALKGLFAGAEKEGYKLYARSGYRSYETQQALFADYVNREGEAAANRYSAKAGQSEHQTGLAMDVTSDSVSKGLKEAFGETDEGRWLAEHAHQYGFIIRYPEGQEGITGYIYEPWHIRYLGVELATKVFDSGLTYEEYANGNQAP
ncbi:D-alanyl-D-alanine carboxypeptidase family protein [Paenibacillus sp. 1011MAR3C5]|uniref:M15 family metallopeptidase n=1 Tax=Paenibacillus sp. 1011MAR3C5 TaxID=1675787 RepID=UPI000E6C839A|nr:M15 family metallopeptidase [Paenibacillus sp. 1011MAR3C5]RJE88440.1 D-alanyl-D-alanine carboxypeptidase family protein [Paenibacillus sp. 1011MAR3C5]